ncbi:hypothetical protein, partial [Bacillus licheniformis]|uniref:hypothetical protein n=1 Tax=Bacillus licheniformis TaxID=1402 RepID=UPI00203E5BD8
KQPSKTPQAKSSETRIPGLGRSLPSRSESRPFSSREGLTLRAKRTFCHRVDIGPRELGKQ